MDKQQASFVTKSCPICAKELVPEEFGVCRARKDGRNLYCKACIRNKVTQSRRALKEYKTARKKYIAQQVELAELQTNELGARQGRFMSQSRLSPVERVRDSIGRGARTQREIAQDTKLGKDEICDAIANLLLWTREIRTRVVDNTRLYFLNEDAEPAEPTQNLPSRRCDVPASFSCLQGLMPGRSNEDSDEKVGGWVAA